MSGRDNYVNLYKPIQINHGVGVCYPKIPWNWEKNAGSINEFYNISKHSKFKDIGGIAVVIQYINWLNDVYYDYMNHNYTFE